MKPILENLKKDKQINGFAEGAFVGTFTTVYRYMTPWIDKGGMFSLVLMPVFEGIRAYLYWLRSSNNGDSINKVVLTRLYFILKAAVTTVGVGLALAGMVTQGFGVIIAGGYTAILRYLGKTIDYAVEGKNAKKVENNLLKTALLGLIVGGFTLLTFFPQFALIGWSMVLTATSFIALPAIPRLLTTMLGMNKQEAMVVKTNGAVYQKSGVVVGNGFEHQQDGPLFLPSQSLKNGAKNDERNRQDSVDPRKK